MYTTAAVRAASSFFADFAVGMAAPGGSMLEMAMKTRTAEALQLGISRSVQAGLLRPVTSKTRRLSGAMSACQRCPGRLKNDP
jgi:hypothetical protein